MNIHEVNGFTNFSMRKSYIDIEYGRILHVYIEHKHNLKIASEQMYWVF